MTLLQHICKFFLHWMFCSELVLSFACVCLVGTGHFIPLWGLSISRSNLASTEKSAAGKVGLTLPRCQCVGSVSSDHSQELALVQPWVVPEIIRHINKFLCKATQENKGSGLGIYTSGLDCHWLKVVNCFEGHVFLAFCILSFCSCKTSLSGTSVFVVALLSYITKVWQWVGVFDHFTTNDGFRNQCLCKKYTTACDKWQCSWGILI